MLQRIRQVRDSELSPEILAEREVWRRKHEIDAQIVVAIEKGNPVSLLLTHPAGLIENMGSCRWLNYTPGDERVRPRQRNGHDLEVRYITQRFADLKARFDAGEAFVELDAEIAGEIQAGKRKGDRKVDALSEIKVRCVKAKRGEHGPDAAKFARSRAHKDLSEFRYQERGKAAGWLLELSDKELQDEVKFRTAATIEMLNGDRVAAGLAPIVAPEE